MSYTVLDLITASLNLIGSLGTGETPNADDASVAFFALNQMLDGWNVDRLNLLNPIRLQPNLTASRQSYQIGPAATDFPTSNPIIQIQSASNIIGGTTARKDISLINSVQFAAIGELGITGVFPDKLYCDYSFPISTMYFHPIPSTSNQIDLFVWQILAAFTSYTQIVNLRPGYEEALEYNLGVKLFPKFGLTPDQITLQLAAQYKQNMRSLNAQALGTALGQSTTLNTPAEGLPTPTPIQP